jgi:hypothetical protein
MTVLSLPAKKPSGAPVRVSLHYLLLYRGKAPVSIDFLTRGVRFPARNEDIVKKMLAFARAFC